jgi:hypothetical protein
MANSAPQTRVRIHRRANRDNANAPPPHWTIAPKLETGTIERPVRASNGMMVRWRELSLRLKKTVPCQLKGAASDLCTRASESCWQRDLAEPPTFWLADEDADANY